MNYILVIVIWCSMFKLSEFFRDIALGELSSTPLVEVGSYELEQKSLGRVIHSLNQALEFLHSNFPLKTNECIIKRLPSISRYYLDSEYAFSNPVGSIKYIVDTSAKPFLDDVLHITSVSSTKGQEFPLNDEFSYTAVQTPEYNCIQLSDRILDEYIVVKYQANHPRIPVNEGLHSQVSIQIPSSYRTALQTYTACLVLQNLGGNHLNESNALYAKFKSLIEELKQNGIGTLTLSGTNIKPMLRGWI